MNRIYNRILFMSICYLGIVFFKSCVDTEKNQSHLIKAFFKNSAHMLNLDLEFDFIR